MSAVTITELALAVIALAASAVALAARLREPAARVGGWQPKLAGFLGDAALLLAVAGIACNAIWILRLTAGA